MTYELLGTAGPKPKFSNGKNGSIICELRNPVDFFFEMDGKVLTASVTHAEDDGKRWLYHTRFSDGYKGVFTISRNLNCILEKGDHAPSAYAKAISDDMYMIYQFDPYQPTPFCLSVDANGEPVKVWAKMEKSGCWFVYFKNGPKFFMHFFSGTWQPEPLEDLGGYLVPEIATAVTEHLNRIIRFTAVNAPSIN